MVNLLYRRQFVVAPLGENTPDGWVVRELTVDSKLATHPDLKTATVARGEVTLTGLGQVVDPNQPENGNVAVLSRLLPNVTTFEGFEKAAYGLAGRWLIFVRIGNETRLYPDAAGMKSAFYVSTDSKDLWIASQPNLFVDLLGLARDEALEARFLAAPHGNSWTGNLTPFAGVRPLLPNHYLDLRDQKAKRFWPTKERESVGLDQLAVETCRILHGTVAALATRGHVAIPLTGGHDSRAIFAAAGALRSSLDFFCIVDPNTPYHDIRLPKKLGRKFGAKVELIKAEGIDPSFWTLHKRNVAGMLWDPGEIKAQTFGKWFSDRQIITGGVAEIGRCFYYKDGAPIDSPSAETLARVSGYGSNPLAIKAFDEWLSDCPPVSWVNRLDLFYWEHRAGNWLSMANTAFDTVCELIPAYNCRAYIEPVLTLDIAFRRKPYRLFQRICEIGAPSSTAIPYNHATLDSIRDAVLSVVPYRIRHRVHQWRMRRAGLAYQDG